MAHVKPKMSNTVRWLFIGIVSVASEAGVAMARHPASTADVGRTPPARVAAAELPPLPEGVEELRFEDFYKPIGDKGLEFTERAQALEGRRVRILGHMVRRCAEPAKYFMLASRPIALHEEEMGPCDDLPAAVLFVHMGSAEERAVYTPGLMLLTGVLSLGSKEEEDGRVSHVRLTLDPNPASPRPGVVIDSHDHTHGDGPTAAHVPPPAPIEEQNP